MSQQELDGGGCWALSPANRRGSESMPALSAYPFENSALWLATNWEFILAIVLMILQLLYYLIFLHPAFGKILNYLCINYDGDGRAYNEHRKDFSVWDCKWNYTACLIFFFFFLNQICQSLPVLANFCISKLQDDKASHIKISFN